ncbi:hypothetical protein HMPREF0373_02424 [Eubacterium ramulus ATCC 29099]|uniref:Uncharacterized protein n=1 Tax=Eubacterium ramulus ATCC 29099 TaxID=1256908 RepID=U2PIC9_EUBRA|nr:hypothetical protein HMPREF0373_02424 [Eubacterium ramulus ATCC 29099]
MSFAVRLKTSDIIPRPVRKVKYFFYFFTFFISTEAKSVFSLDE